MKKLHAHTHAHTHTHTRTHIHVHTHTALLHFTLTNAHTEYKIVGFQAVRVEVRECVMSLHNANNKS